MGRPKGSKNNSKKTRKEKPEGLNMTLLNNFLFSAEQLMSDMSLVHRETARMATANTNFLNIMAGTQELLKNIDFAAPVEPVEPVKAETDTPEPLEITASDLKALKEVKRESIIGATDLGAIFGKDPDPVSE